MADYVVSARKYRPETFETLIGQDNIAKTLKNSILRGQLAHAYLFCGPRGVGKTSTARIFAKTINCSNPGPELQPCGECESCLSFKEGRSYCIHELDAASNNGVDDIKTLMEQVQIPPQTGRYSVYIIDEVHMLSASAFNAFLKTLEEPPAHAIFILATTEKHKILPTILSRCQTYDFNRIGVADMVKNLRSIASRENIDIGDDSLHVIAHKADGAMRDALTIFDQTVAFCGNKVKYEDVLHNLNVLDYEYCFRLVDAFLAGDYATAFLIFDEVLSKGFNSLYFVSTLASHLRDLLVSRTGGLESLLNLPDTLRRRYAEQAAKCQLRFLYDALSVCSQCEAGYRTASNQRLHIEFALMKLSFLNSAPQPAVQAVAPQSRQPVEARTSAAPSAPAVAAAPEQPAAASEKPAVQPAVAYAGAKEDKGQARPRGSRGGSSLSLSSLMKEAEASAPAEAAPTPSTTEAKETVVLDEAAITARWQELAAQFGSQPRLSNALSNAGLKLCPDLGDGRKYVEFSVVSDAQKRWIEEKVLRRLEENFGQLLGCGVKLVPTVIPDDGTNEKRVYTPTEKAEYIMSHNEEVRGLVKDLSLDVN